MSELEKKLVEHLIDVINSEKSKSILIFRSIMAVIRVINSRLDVIEYKLDLVDNYEKAYFDSMDELDDTIINYDYNIKLKGIKNE